MSVLLAIAIACSGEAPPPSVGERWASGGAADRAAVLAEIEAASSPEAAILLLDELEAAAPGTLSREHCAVLSEPSVRASCLRGANRPHLAGPHLPVAERTLPAPYASLWPPPGSSPLHQVPATAGCPDAGCRTREATAALLAGQVEAAAGWCSGLQGQARDECWFRAAEAAAAEPEVMVLAVPACFAAGDFVHECLSHAVDGWTAGPPAPADAPAVAAWQDRLGAITAALSQQAPRAEGPTIVAAVRTCATERLVRHAPAGPVATWPGAAADLRASLAARLLDTSDLARQAGRVLAVAAGQAALPARVADDPPLREVEVMWEELLPAEQAWLAATSSARVVGYRGYSNAVRVAVEDPAEDATIAVLEAAARAEPPRLALLREGQAHPSPAVRWTAARLGARLGAPMATDPDPFVASRTVAP